MVSLLTTPTTSVFSLAGPTFEYIYADPTTTFRTRIGHPTRSIDKVCFVSFTANTSEITWFCSATKIKLFS